MKAYVVTHSSTYESRAEEVGSWLREQGAEVTWIFSDFDHRTLKNVFRKEPDHIYLHMAPYSGNLSLNRLRSIGAFARETEKYLSGRRADLLYFLIPANSLVPAAKRLKAQTGARVVFDIIDLWPESLPVSHADRLPPLYVWKGIRDRSLSCGDLIFTECALYQELLSLPQDRTRTLYWFREDTGCGALEENRDIPAEQRQEGTAEQQEKPFWPEADDGRLHIAYIGAINNIIDIEGITKLLSLIRKHRQVILHVIGYGRRKEAFLHALDEAGIQSEDYGAVFDETEKAHILGTCSFGINMMVPQVRVGLTMKSLDYLAYGLPLLNNLSGDTWQLVEEYDAGVNILRDDPEASVPAILAMAEDPLAGKDARRLYEEHFTELQFRNALEKNLRPLLRTCAPESEGTAGNMERTGSRGIGRRGPDGRRKKQSGIRSSRNRQEAGTWEKQAAENAPESSHAETHTPVSVAMAACNGEKYLAEQLDSILPQLGEKDEVVVSVDPSQDRTFEILCEYAASDPRIRVLEGPGRGVVRNVENTLRNCRGELIFLSDQDDVWMPDKAEKVKRALEHSTLVLHDAVIADAGLSEISPSFMNWRKSRKGMLANIRKNSYIGCCMAFRRELLQYILPFPENLPMHDQWIGLMAEKHGSVRLLRIPLILYRRHGANATAQTHAGPVQMIKWRAEITGEVLRR